MKKYLMVAILCMACKNSVHSVNSTVTELSETDSILSESAKSFESAVAILKKVDKKSEEKVQEISENMSDLKGEIASMKEKIKITKNKTVRDTVYITEKKNFWGKTKSSVTIKTDSTLTIDSTENKQ